VARLVLSYLGAYVVADWVSYLYPLAPFAITPWNPPPGLSLALLLLCGLRYAPAVLVAVLTADAVVRDVPGPPWAMLASALVIAGGYSAVAALLLRALRIDPGLKSLRDLSWLLACVAAGTALIACAYVGVYVLAGQIARSQAADHALRFWIGDMIGVVVTTPLVLVVVARRPIGRSWEVAAQAGAIVLALALVFGVGYPVASPLFYLLFLPLVWIAMRHGFRGAAYAAFATQIGLIAAARVTGHSASSVLEMQFLMLALAVTSLLLGMAVSERREAVERLSEKQEDLARTLRLAAAGEMASALAHELNQPLSAIVNYLRACQLMLARPESERARLADTMNKVVVEAARAGDVVRRLRDFFRTGTSRLESLSIGRLVETAVEPLRERAERHGIQLRVDAAPVSRPALVDRMQLEIVIHNLVGNAIEAIAASDPPQRRVLVTVGEDATRTRVEVRDTGPGVMPEIAQRLFEPFATSKPQGMGLGLAISRSIVEAHGGQLWAESAEVGGVFCFTLPLESSEEGMNG
jgi:two-component system sensor kinase FixL